MLLQTDLFITRLRCAEPPHISAFPSLFPWHLVATSTVSAHVRMNPSSNQASPDICAACVSTSLRTQGSVSTLRSLDFQLSVRQSRPLFLTSCFGSLKAADSSPLCDPKRQPRTSSSYTTARSFRAFVRFLLGQVFRPHVSGVFAPRHFRDDQSAHGVPLPLAPTRLGYGDVSLVSHSAS